MIVMLTVDRRKLCNLRDSINIYHEYFSPQNTPLFSCRSDIFVMYGIRGCCVLLFMLFVCYFFSGSHHMHFSFIKNFGKRTFSVFLFRFFLFFSLWKQITRKLNQYPHDLCAFVTILVKIGRGVMILLTKKYF